MTKPKLWGGVFSKPPDELAWKFGQSLVSDVTLIAEEFEVSSAHAEMLGACGIIPLEDAKVLTEGLMSVWKGLQSGTVALPENAEDLHGAIEELLVAEVGETAKKLHAGRSRNDQIVTVTKLWLKRQCAALEASVAKFQAALLSLAEDHVDDPMPGYTHQQPAQPVTIGFWLMAMFGMLERDKARIVSLRTSVDACPLGAAALSGTSLPLDRKMTCKALGFAAPVPNALDAVSDRDFIGDALHMCAQLMQHLSRMCQEIVLFSTSEFGYVHVDEAYSTGSSIMPQKRNPDIAELIRGRSGRVLGNWTAFMSTMKALPLGYNRDQQEDKPPLFDSLSLSKDSLALTQAMFETLTFDLGRMKVAAGKGFSTATSVAEALVLSGVPFRTAHELVGKAVKTCVQLGFELHELPQSEFPEGTPPSFPSALKTASVEASISGRSSEGGTSPNAVRAQIAQARTLLKNP